MKYDHKHQNYGRNTRPPSPPHPIYINDIYIVFLYIWLLDKIECDI